MRSTWHSWDATLAKLGFRRVKKRSRRRRGPIGRRCLFEPLEDRRVLSTNSPAEDPWEPQFVEASSGLTPVHTIPATAEFVIVGGASRNLFDVATEYVDGAPVAFLSLSSRASATKDLQHTIELELRDGRSALMRYEVTFTMAADEFLAAYRADRVATAAKSLSGAASLAETRLDELVDRAELRKTQWQQGQTKTAATLETSARTAADDFGSFFNGATDSTTSKTASATTRDFLSANERKQAGEAAILLADKVRTDLASGDAARVAAAQLLRNQVLASADYGDVLWMGYQANSQVLRTEDAGPGQVRHSAIYEAGRLQLNDAIAVDFGRAGVVEVTTTPLNFAFSGGLQIAALGVDAGATTTATATNEHGIYLWNGSPGAYPVVDPMHVVNFPGYDTGDLVMDGVMRFDLEPFTQYVDAATLTVSPVAGPSGSPTTSTDARQAAVIVEHDSWTSSSAWDEFPERTDGRPVLTTSGASSWYPAADGQGGFEAVQLDVSDYVREKLRRGDMNVNFLRGESSGTAEVTDDINAFEMAVKNAPSYLAAFGMRLSGLQDELDRGDLNRDGTIDAADAELFIETHGYRQGDRDLDGDVDGWGFLEWQRDYGQVADYFGGDYDFSGIIDGGDLAVWSNNFGLPQPAEVENALSLRIYAPDPDQGPNFTEFVWYATSGSSTVEVEQPGDAVLTRFDTTATGQWQVRYNILNHDATSLTVKVYRSSDGVALDDELLSVPVTDPSQLGPGIDRTLSLTPTLNGVTLTDSDRLVAVIEATFAGGEADPNNNQALFYGGAFKLGNVLHLMGSDRDDTFEVSASGGVYTINGATSVSGVSTIESRLYGGDDRVLAASSVTAPVTAWSGDGDDILYGGSGNDLLYGEAGHDILMQGGGGGLLDWGNGGPRDALVVTTLADESEWTSGVFSTAFGIRDVSLREAIALANFDATADIIEFDAAMQGTIALDPTLAQISIAQDVEITGPGKDLLKIDAQGELVSGGRRVFMNNATATTTIRGVTLTGGYFDASNSDGGGLYNYGSLTLDAVRVADNFAGRNGGGIYSTGGSLIVTDSEVSGNTALYGGGMNVSLNDATDVFRLENSTVFGNAAHNASGSGGVGGGLSLGSSVVAASATIVNSTFSGNTSGVSGAIRLGGSVDLTITNSTITENIATGNNGAGISGLNSSQLTLQNSIVANNVTNWQYKDIVDWSSATWQADHTIFGTVGNTGIPINAQSGNQAVGAGVPVGLSPLGDFGGPTQTHVLLPGSPAIDAGSVLYSPASDQRGVFRSVLPDIGATEFEFGASAPHLLPVALQHVEPGSSLLVDLEADYVHGVLSNVAFANVPGNPANVVVTPVPGQPGKATLQWQSDAGVAPGSYSLEVDVYDATAPSRRSRAAITVIVGPPNQAPFWDSGYVASVVAGAAAAVNLAATDPDGDVHRLRYAKGANAPANVRVNPVTGALTWATTINDVGVHVFDVLVTDGGSPTATASTTVQLDVLAPNVAPLIAGPSTIQIAEDSQYVFDSSTTPVTVSDQDGNDAAMLLAVVVDSGTVQMNAQAGVSFLQGTSGVPSSQLLIRGAPTDLNAALNGLTYLAEEDYFGKAEVRFELNDLGNGGMLEAAHVAHAVLIDVTSAVDAPTLLDQTLYVSASIFAPPPTNMSEEQYFAGVRKAGRVNVVNPDPQAILNYFITAGNETGRFAINHATGEITVTSRSAVTEGASYPLTVRVEYEDAPALFDTATITVRAEPLSNNEPQWQSDVYYVDEDEVVVGNVLLGDAFGGAADSDPESSSLFLKRVYFQDGTEFAFGETISVEGGALLTVESDGSVVYDPSVSDEFDRGLSSGTSGANAYFRYDVADAWGRTNTGWAAFYVNPVNDLHSADSQVLSVAPDAAWADLVGTVRVRNVEINEPLQFTITGGNTGSAFAIDYAGRVTVQSPAQLAPGQLYPLQIDVTDEDNRTIAVNVDVHVRNDLAPESVERWYDTAEDAPLAGNVLLDGAQGGALLDPEGQPLAIIAVGDRAENVGKSIRLASGAVVTVQASGEFQYEPSPSDILDRLNAGSEYPDVFHVTVRNAWGAETEIPVTIQVSGRNDAPTAADIVYSTTDKRILTGNLLADEGPERTTGDVDAVDQLFVSQIDGTAISGPTTVATRLGATLTVKADGTFQYDPASISGLSQLAVGASIYDAFVYEAIDAAGDRPDSGVVRVKVTRTPTSVSGDLLRIEQFALANDTGGSAGDRVTSDPTVAGEISGLVAGAYDYLVEFNLDADGTTSNSTVPVDEALVVSPGDAGFPGFQFDPSSSTDFSDAPGEKVVAYRVSARDSAGTVLTQTITDDTGLQSTIPARSEWRYFRFTLEDAPNEGPLRLVGDVTPFYIPPTINEEDGSISPGYATSDPRLTGVVHGDFTGHEVRVDFSYSRGGTPYGGSVTMSASGQFVFDLRTVDPALADWADDLVISYNVVAVDVVGSDPDATIASGTTDLDFEPAPWLNAYASLVEADDQQAGYYGNSRRVEGVLTWGPGGPAQDQVFVEFDYADAAGQFDGAPDGETIVIVDGESGAYSYSYVAVGLQGANPKIRSRVREWLPEKGTFAYGDWSYEVTLSPRESPDIASVEVVQPDSGERAAPTIDGYLAGAAVGETAGAISSQTDLSGVGFVTIQFFHHGNPLTPSSIPDATVVTDAQGRFSYKPRDLDYGSTYLQARSVVQVDDVGTLVYGNPHSNIYVSLSQPILPDLYDSNLELQDEGSEQQFFDKLRWVTSDPSIQGTLVDYSASVPFSDVEIEFAHDYVNVAGDENVVVGYATADAAGQFAYRPYDLAPGDVTLRARVSYFDPAVDDYVVGSWANIDLHLEASQNVLATVVDLQLTDDDGASPPHVKQATITGRIENPDGPVAYTVVQFDVDANDANGILGTTITDAAGEFTFVPTGLTPGASTIIIQARAADWDYGARQQVFGPWSTGAGQIEFVLDPAVPLEVVAGSLALVSDSGSSHTDGNTANPLVAGRINGDGSLGGVAIAMDVGDDGSIDAVVETDDYGGFSYLPTGLSPGVHVIRAHVASWNADTNSYTYSTGDIVSFTLESQANAAAAITFLQLKNPPASGPATDATIVGQIANEGSLAGVVVEVDFDGSDANGINQSTTTDALGRFELTPTLLSPGTASLRVRTREIDPASGAVLVSSWTSLTPFTYQPIVDARPTLASLDYTLSFDTPSVYGTVSDDGPTEDIVVELSYSENGPIIGTAAVDAFGYYSHDLAELQSGQQYTIWARAKEIVGASAQYSDSLSRTFTFTPWGNSVTSFQLAVDTANGGTSTAADGSTENATLVGQISGPNSLDNVSIYFYADTDGNGDREYLDYAVTDASGAFTFSYAPTESGFYSIEARIGSSESPGTTQVANFVFDTDDSSPQALALVNAFAAVDPLWQASATFGGLAAGDLANAIYATAASNAAGDYDFTVALAEYQRQLAQTAAEESYAQQQTAAEAAYKEAVDQAQAAFVSALNALPAGDRAAFDLADFVWPDAPDDNALSLPNQSSLPQPAAAPKYTGPTFEAANDPAYQSEVAQAERNYAIAVRDARQQYESDKRDAEDDYQDAVAGAMENYADALKAAGDALEALQGDDPEFDSAAYQSLVDRINAAWRGYQDAVNSNAERYSDAVSDAEDASGDAVNRINQDQSDALAQASDDAYDDDWESHECPDGTEWQENSPPEVEAYKKAEYQIIKRYAEQRERAKNAHAEALANARREQAQANARALQDALEEVYDAQRDMAQLSRDHRHAQVVDNASDQYQFATLLAAAREQLAGELAAAAAARDKAVADAAYTRDESVAGAARDREQAISYARLTATQIWAQATGTAWAGYQAQLAANADIYNQQVAASGYDRDVAIAAARKAAAYVVADADEAKATAAAAAEHVRAVGLAEKLKTYEINADAIYTTRDKALADLWYEYRVDVSLAREAYAIDVADIEAEYGTGGSDGGTWIWVVDLNGAAPYWSSNGIKQSKALHKLQATNEWAQDIYILDWCDVEWRYELDNSDTRQNAHDTYYRELAEITRDGAMLREDAEETLDHGVIDALETYRQQAAAVVKDAVVDVANEQYAYQTGVADVQHAYHVALVQAEADHAVELTRAEAIEDYGIIAADADYDTDESGLARTLQIDNAGSQKSYEVSEATGYLVYVTSWAAGAPTRWGAYQVDLAEAEVARVTSLGDARIVRATGLGDASVAWTGAVVDADLAYGATLYGGAEGGGALVARSQTIADAHVAIAQSDSLVDFVSAQAGAVRTHDQGVAEANRSLSHEIAALDAERDREVSSATHDYHRAVHQALYEYHRSRGQTQSNFIDPEYVQAEKAAKKERDVRVAKANEARAVGIAEARRDWTYVVGDLNVAFVEQLVAAQQDRAAALREEIIILATAVSAAQETYLTTEATAIQQHVGATASADATSRTSRASVEATYAASVTSTLNAKSEADAAALGVYEVGLYDDHAAATAAHHAAENTALSLYQNLVAVADHTWAIAKAAARDLYHQALSAIETSQTVQRNAAFLGEAQTSANANKAFAIGQAAVDQSYAATNASADAALYLAKKTAEADLIVAATDAQGAADIAYAKAVRDRDNAYADANVAWVKTTAAAYTSLVVGDIDNEEYAEIVDAANETRQGAKDAADKAFGRAVDKAGAEQATELGAARLAYVEAVGSAKVDHATTTADAEVGYATGSSQGDNRLVAELAKAAETQENLLRTADYNQTVTLAAEDVSYATRLRDAGATLAGDRGQAEGDYHLAQAQAEATLWANASAAAPEDDYFRFRAAEAASRAAWFGALTGAYATFRSQVAYGEGQASVDLASVRANQLAQQAAATLAYQKSVAAAERQRTIDRAAAQNAGYVESTRHESDLTVDVALAEYDYGNAYAQAVVDDEITRDAIARDDLSYEAENDALKKSAYARAVALAAAERDWQLAASGAEFSFASAEAGTEHNVLDRLAGVESRFSVTLAQAEATRDVAWALAEQTKLVDEAIAENDEREGRALASANFQTDKYAAKTAALDELVLGMPRAEGQIHGIAVGYAAGDLQFTPNVYAGSSDAGEFTVAGTSFTRHTSAGGQTSSLGTLGAGVAVDDSATGAGYLMFSAASVHARFAANAPAAGAADHVIAVRYSGGQWQYNNDAGWFAFTPAADDLLLAEVDFTADTVYGLGGYLPWAEYERDRAAAEEAAWADLKDDYLQWQEDVGAAYLVYATTRGAEHVAAVTGMAGVQLSYAAQSAAEIEAHVRRAADIQRDFSLSLADLTAAYRTAAAQADYAYAVANAAGVRDGDSQQQSDAADALNDALSAADEDYHEGYSTEDSTRRIDLAESHFQLISVTADGYLASSENIAAFQADFDADVNAAYYSPSAGVDSLEERLAQLEYDYSIAATASQTAAYDGLAVSNGSPWAVLAQATTTADETHLAGPLAQQQLDRRLALAAAEVDARLAENAAARDRRQTEATAARDLALIEAVGLLTSAGGTAEQGVLPGGFSAPVPDLGSITVVSANYAVAQPGAIGDDMWYYGSSGWWGWYGYGSYYTGDYGQFDVGGGSEGLVGGFGAYFGGWGYGYGPFVWGGWSPSYVATSASGTGAGAIDPEAEVAAEESTLSWLKESVIDVAGALLAATDVPVYVDAAIGAVGIGLLAMPGAAQNRFVEKIAQRNGDHWNGRRVLDLLEANIPEAMRFVKRHFTLLQTSNGSRAPVVTIRRGEGGSIVDEINKKHLYSEYSDTSIWLEVPSEWTDFEVASFILQQINSHEDVSELFELWTFTGEVVQDAAKIRDRWNKERIPQGLAEAAAIAGDYYKALVSFIPGGSAALFVHEVENEEYLAAAFEVAFMGPVFKVAGHASASIAFKIGEDLIDSVPVSAIEKFHGLRPEQQAEALKILRKPGGDAKEAVANFILYLKGKFGLELVGGSALDKRAVEEAAKRLDLFADVRKLTKAEKLAKGSNWIGDQGEILFKKLLDDAGYKDYVAIQNASGHGVDVIAKLDDGSYAVFEVKASVTGNFKKLPRSQYDMERFLRTRLATAANKNGNFPAAAQARAEELLDEIRNNGFQNISGNRVNVNLSTESVTIGPWK